MNGADPPAYPTLLLPVASVKKYRRPVRCWLSVRLNSFRGQISYCHLFRPSGVIFVWSVWVQTDRLSPTVVIPEIQR